ncbi:hypothetical protein CO009_01275 [Candidatus Shapirobacteria bacterium CG_4_8_14_3_um_filter_35_11]|uniref:EamA domain-containing protein n=1 Tax=Candidatus Shapirobacteria bacterium CG_4_8_14_3_um_filter_35_11 TaxID=1974874 RepID=A0A2M8GK47_9BACT|nr:MAG: hypothetical protein CO009_01275 [Candidatus Shapirobacteria bacterium CG_4_8_14_3_um_filter_35_11]
MNWLSWALTAAFFGGVVDILFKLVNGKINNSLSGVIINACSIIPVLAFAIYSKINGQTLNSSKMGIIYSILAGLAIGFITLSSFKMFNDPNADLSIAIPVMRVTIILMAILFGIIFLRESISLKFIIGLILSLIGLYLVSTSRT